MGQKGYLSPYCETPYKNNDFVSHQLKDTGRLYVIKGMMRQEQYKDVVQNCSIPQLEVWFPNGEPCIFMQDGAPCHTARFIKAVLAEQNIPLLDCLGNSPDMRTIENVWELMKREVAKDMITNKTQLLERIIHVWNHHPQMQETVQSCIDSMPRRIEALIAAKVDLRLVSSKILYQIGDGGSIVDPYPCDVKERDFGITDVGNNCFTTMTCSSQNTLSDKGWISIADPYPCDEKKRGFGITDVGNNCFTTMTCPSQNTLSDRGWMIYCRSISL
ncbi:uncharacterized protein TNCV_3745091 [Trichonephila clavipes]|nr:uncharacterized protein TNCV_3745091 [Trichonephila clavipes]